MKFRKVNKMDEIDFDELGQEKNKLFVLINDNSTDMLSLWDFKEH